ncbi:MAG: MBL fold metallo-hydrolase [Planctomycetota bacterium]|jgi:L-ascorbate metabolism protein UlaG (beta-lactamase superfamily)
MKNHILPLAAIVCLMGWQASVPAQQGESSGKDSNGRLSKPSNVERTTIPVSSKDGMLPVSIKWWGQACVSIETFWGFTIVIDPYPEDNRLGYPKPDLTADLILITHNHFDHTGVASIKGKPIILRGLTPNGDWASINHFLDRLPNRPKPTLVFKTETKCLSPHAVHIQGIKTFHDNQSGAQRGKNTMMLVDTEGVRILHCGDLGHTLTDEQLKAMGPIDLLLVPVGGKYTIDSAEALRIVQQIKPRRWTWPIHFNTGVCDLPLDKIDTFEDQAKQTSMAIRRVQGNAIAITRRPSDKSSEFTRPACIISDFKPAQLKPEMVKALSTMRKTRQVMVDRLGQVSKAQLDHKPANGTHTIRWNFEHTTGRELKFFSEVYHVLDPEIPVIDWNPAQMPPDFKPRYPEWNTVEMVRHVQRVGAFTDRFSYLLADIPVEKKIKGTRFSVRSLSDLMVRHYRDHTAKAVSKFTLSDWPKH